MIIITAVVATAEKISLTGTVAVIGNEPFTKLIFSANNNQKYLLDKNELWQELFKLQGANLRIEGFISNSNDPIFKTPKLEVSDYEILWIGEGENRQTPWVGTININDNLVYLQTSKQKSYQIIGPNVEIFKNYPNAKVWVTGTQKKQWFKKNNQIYVTAYCIIKEAPPTTSN